VAAWPVSRTSSASEQAFTVSYWTVAEPEQADPVRDDSEPRAVECPLQQPGCTRRYRACDTVMPCRTVLQVRLRLGETTGGETRLGGRSVGGLGVVGASSAPPGQCPPPRPLLQLMPTGVCKHPLVRLFLPSVHWHRRRRALRQVTGPRRPLIRLRSPAQISPGASEPAKPGALLSTASRSQRRAFFLPADDKLPRGARCSCRSAAHVEGLPPVAPRGVSLGATTARAGRRRHVQRSRDPPAAAPERPDGLLLLCAAAAGLPAAQGDTEECARGTRGESLSAVLTRACRLCLRR